MEKIQIPKSPLKPIIFLRSETVGSFLLFKFVSLKQKVNIKREREKRYHESIAAPRNSFSLISDDPEAEILKE